VRIAVTGREGQVARSLAECALGRDGLEIVLVGRPELDLTRPETVEPVLAAVRPDLVVSAAAYTAVDQAEDEPDLAHEVNGSGAGAVARAAAGLGAPVIHLSTDYVFDGEASRPYREDDPTGPVSAYGASKLAGEQAVAAANPRHVIMRTAWVYSPLGKNFVKTMLRLAADRDEIAVVSDQWGNPTSALDIANAILHAAPMLLKEENPAVHGLFHVAGTGDANWSGFARRVLETSRSCGGPFADVREILTSDYPTKARRPANSRLASAKFASVFGWTAPAWQVSADHAVQRILGQSEVVH
jgi:dTDP-4-dehydrorhamnose reductase